MVEFFCLGYPALCTSVGKENLFLHFVKGIFYTDYWTFALGTWEQLSFKYKPNIAVVVALQMFIKIIIINLLSVAIKSLN